MPLYRVEHAVPLLPSQKDELAAAITDLHSTRFTTAKMFVNVEFIDASNACTYIGGKLRPGNHIKANVRSGPSRTQQDWDDLSLDIGAAWDRIVGPGLPEVKMSRASKSGTEDRSLRSVILLGGMIGGLEAGFVLPPAGGDVQWMRDNMEAFKKKAAAGDEEFVDMVKEIEERGLLGQPLDKDKEAARRLEQMMGWGDSD